MNFHENLKVEYRRCSDVPFRLALLITYSYMLSVKRKLKLDIFTQSLVLSFNGFACEIFLEINGNQNAKVK